MSAGTRGVCALIVVVSTVVAGCKASWPPRPATDRATLASIVGSQADCRPEFLDQDGWLGGDVAASIPLEASGERRSVWLFGDSFVSPPGRAAERRYPFVHNAIALSRCDRRGRFTLDFAWGRESASSNPAASPTDLPQRAYFEPDPTDPWVARVPSETGAAPYYWPLSGIEIEGTLFVALLRVAPAPARGPFRLPFRAVGVELARIERPTGPPETWSVRRSMLSSRGDLLPATSLVVDGDHLYAFANVDRGDGHTPRVLTRIPLDALARWRPDLEPELEILATDGRWLAGLDPASARVLMDDDASEMSVHFDPDHGVWLAVYGDPTTDAVWLRRARELAGPWSAPIPLARIPELSGQQDALPGEPFCYAGKAHPELAPAGQLAVSYVCNLFVDDEDGSKGDTGSDGGEDNAAHGIETVGAVLERLRTTTWLYRPKWIRVAVPPG